MKVRAVTLKLEKFPTFTLKVRAVTLKVRNVTLKVRAVTVTLFN